MIRYCNSYVTRDHFMRNNIKEYIINEGFWVTSNSSSCKIYGIKESEAKECKFIDWWSLHLVVNTTTPLLCVWQPETLFSVDNSGKIYAEPMFFVISWIIRTSKNPCKVQTLNDKICVFYRPE